MTTAWREAWNKTVELLTRGGPALDILLESLWDKANRNILNGENTEAAKGAIACMRSYSKRHVVPSIIR